jgi:hypothetical protein
MFRPVITAIIRQFYNNITGKNGARGFCFYIQTEVCIFVITQNNEMKNCVSINWVKYKSVLVTMQYFYIVVALPDDGCNYWPKHVVVQMINK